MTKRLTQKQAEIVTGFTGKLALQSFEEFQRLASDKLLDHIPIHAFASKALWSDLREAYRQEFTAIAADRSNGWVKCRDALPAEGSQVLVLSSGNYSLATMRRDYVADLPYWQNEDFDRMQYVTHWQELPELPA